MNKFPVNHATHKQECLEKLWSKREDKQYLRYSAFNWKMYNQPKPETLFDKLLKLIK